MGGEVQTCVTQEGRAGVAAEKQENGSDFGRAVQEWKCYSAACIGAMTSADVVETIQDAATFS